MRSHSNSRSTRTSRCRSNSCASIRRMTSPAASLAALRWAKTSKSQRKAAGSHAAKERWRKWREKQAEK